MECYYKQMYLLICNCHLRFHFIFLPPPPIFFSISSSSSSFLSLFCSSLLSVWVLVSDLTSIFSAEAICVAPICMDQTARDTFQSSQPATANKECRRHLEFKYSPFTSVEAFCNVCHFQWPVLLLLEQEIAEVAPNQSCRRSTETWLEKNQVVLTCYKKSFGLLWESFLSERKTDSDGETANNR